MDERELFHKLEDMEHKLDEVYKSTERTRKYFLWTMIISIAIIILPLIAVAFLLPSFFDLYSGSGDVNTTLDALGL